MCVYSCTRTSNSATRLHCALKFSVRTLQQGMKIPLTNLSRRWRWPTSFHRDTESKVNDAVQNSVEAAVEQTVRPCTGPLWTSVWNVFLMFSGCCFTLSSHVRSWKWTRTLCAFITMVLKAWLNGTPNPKQKHSEDSAGAISLLSQQTQSSRPTVNSQADLGEVGEVRLTWVR